MTPWKWFRSCDPDGWNGKCRFGFLVAGLWWPFVTGARLSCLIVFIHIINAIQLPRLFNVNGLVLYIEAERPPCFHPD